MRLLPRAGMGEATLLYWRRAARDVHFISGLSSRHAIDGRLPHGMGVSRVADLPAECSRQRRILGLASH
jgi:hypothetical protein